MKENSLYGFIQSLSLEGGPPPQIPQGVLLIAKVYQLVWFLIVAVIVAMIALMVLRFVLNYVDLNPFSRPVILVRRLTDPFVFSKTIPASAPRGSAASPPATVTPEMSTGPPVLFT